MRASLLAAGLLALGAACSQAQDTTPIIRPGDARVDASRLPLRSDTFLLAPQPKLALRLVISTRRATLEQGPALLRVETISVPGGEALSADSFAARSPSLAPLFDQEFAGDNARQLRFSADSVTGSRLDEGERKQVAERLAAPAFYMNTTDLLLGSLELREGMRFRLGMWDPDHGAYTVLAQVRPPETVLTVEEGRCSAWRVETAEQGVNSVYWIEVRSHTMLRYQANGLEIRAYRHPSCPARVSGAARTR
jgi:hypothetical protein